MRWYLGIVLLVVALVSLFIFGCQGPPGPTGPPGPQGPVGPPGPGVTPTATTPPEPPVVVNAGNDVTAAPGASVTLKVTANINDNSEITGIKWTQVSGAVAQITGDTTDTATVKLADALAYKAQLIKNLETLDRFGVQAINPESLGTAESASFKVTITTSSGSYNDNVIINASIPYIVNPGLANVAIGEPVLIQSKKMAAYDWIITPPSGSKTVMNDSTTQNPTFTPDIPGKYTLTEMKSSTNLEIYAGTWEGAITGQDSKGRPIAAACTTCHNNKVAPDVFSAWKDTGHAEIFTQNIDNPAGHWSLSCAGCHTVGYDSNIANGGFDAAIASANWTPPPHGEEGLFTEILKDYPDVAKYSNAQCENCHGPNNTSLHVDGIIDAARVSISSDVCGTCHGEPARHGRFQQWEESGHSNYELAVEEATVENRGATAAHCGRCHSAQGFLQWIQQSDLTKYIQGANGNATVDELKALGLTVDEVQPQACVTCHDPHAEGNLSGEPTNATVRIINDTALLPAGFKAEEVGKGALCMTCHNTRNSLHNQDNPPTSYSGPHDAAQADVFMGENAYFVNRSERSPHSYITDTCVTCHLEKTPPPAELSYNLSGTNHSFTASLSICADCHSSQLNGAALQAGVVNKLNILGEAMGEYLIAKIPSSVLVIDYTAHTYDGKSYELASDNAAVSKDNIVSILPADSQIHGQISFVLKFKTPVNFTYAPTGETPHTISLLQAEVQLRSILSPDDKPVISATDDLVKASWNYFLIKNDSSKGVHNPEFAHDVLDAAINALK